jgi:aspartate aminotransferase-like enzyme
MPGLLPDIDPDGLLEYSVVFTDRSLNHMSQSFQAVMIDISSTLKRVYGATAVVVVPGGGRHRQEVYRDSQRVVQLPLDADVRHGRHPGRVHRSEGAPRRRCQAQSVCARTHRRSGRNHPGRTARRGLRPTCRNIVGYDLARRLCSRRHGGLFVLDCIASGSIWVDMEASGVDVLISAPQKGWSSSPCAGLVMLSPLARERIESTTSTSFAADLRKWLEIMEAYERGGHAYHATMPTDDLVRFRDMMKETEAWGLDRVRTAQQELGDRVRALLASRDIRSVAGEGFEAPGVVVCYTDDADIANGKKFRDVGLQIAAGVPLRCDEPDDFRSFRLGLFGLDKLHHVDRTVNALADALDQMNANDSP